MKGGTGMDRPRLPTLRKIMELRNCDMARARTIRAFMEADADTVYHARTGRHFLECVAAEDFAKNPSLATC